MTGEGGEDWVVDLSELYVRCSRLSRKTNVTWEYRGGGEEKR